MVMAGLSDSYPLGFRNQALFTHLPALAPPVLHCFAHFFGLAESLVQGAAKMAPPSLSFTVALQKPLGEVMETASMLYVVYAIHTSIW